MLSASWVWVIQVPLGHVSIWARTVNVLWYLLMSCLEAMATRRSCQAGDFVDDLNKYKRPSDIDLTHHALIGLDSCVELCMKVILSHVGQAMQTAGFRVPPLMLSRCMRGGKTTVLCAVFDRLQRDGHNPIWVSFNGTSGIRMADGETPHQTMTRAIAAALLKETSDNNAPLQCEEETIHAYLKGKKAVLLIDELNILLKPGVQDVSVGSFLRKEFLDPVSKYLVFTTHVPIGNAVVEYIGAGGGSQRDVKLVDLPLSDNMAELRLLDPALTDSMAAFFSCMPSLIYSVKVDSYEYKQRFDSAIQNLGKDRTEQMQQAFVDEFLSGKRQRLEMRSFDSLTMTPSIGEVRWVLCYAALMSEWLGLRAISKQLQNLHHAVQRSGSGDTWENILRIAISFRCVEATFKEAHLLLGLPHGASVNKVFFLDVPQEIKAPEEAQEWRKNQKVAKVHPYLAVLNPVNAGFKLFDTITVYQNSADEPPHVQGFQMKEGKTTVRADAPEGMTGLLMRGKAPSFTTGSSKAGWTYPDEDMVRSFLGASLQTVYPGSWPKTPTT